VEESKQVLASQLQELDARLHTQSSAILSLARDYVRYDDYALQKLAAASNVDVDDGKTLNIKAAKLTEKLGIFSCDEIQCRMDRVYLETVALGDAAQEHGHNALDEQELEQDLKSLSVEIADVAAMSAFQEFQGPLLQTLGKHRNQRHNENRVVLEDVCN
jgi:hypothetical protein